MNVQIYTVQHLHRSVGLANVPEREDRGFALGRHGLAVPVYLEERAWNT